MAPIPTKSQTTEDLYQEAMKLYNEAVDAEKEQRDQCVEDIQFANVAGAQWDDWAKEARGNRPRLEINKVALPVNVYMGNFRQNDMSVTFRPSSGGATRKTAEVYKGLTRHILERSNWDSIANNAAKEQATGGIGAWRVMTQFSSDDTFEQEIRVGMIRSAATSVFYDPSAQKESKEDMNHCFVTEFVADKVFRKKYPDAAVTGVPDPTGTQVGSIRWRGNWFQPDRVRIAEYWVRTRIKQTLLLMSDGSTIIEEEAESVLDELAAEDPPILQVDSREVMRHKVVRYLMTGAEFIEGPEEWPGQTIPIIPVFGYNTWIDGTHHYRGMVRFGKDPQRAYNYLSSQRIENETLAPKDVIFMTKGQMKGFTEDYRKMNVEHKPVYFYNNDDKAVSPPFRLGNAAPQVELAAQLVQADQDIQATTGKFSPELGQNLGDQSGVALRALNQVGDQATFEFTDNFVNGMFVMGGIFAELIPKFFSSEQTVRIIGDDLSEDFVEINREVRDEQSGEMVMLHDITAGKYDQKVDIGPTHSTQRTEGLEALSAIARDNPNAAPLMVDLIAKNMDFPFAAELERRFRRPMLAQGIVEPNEEEKEQIDKAKAEAEGQQQGPTPEEEAQALQLDQMEMTRDLMRARVETEEAKADKTRADVGKTIADTINVRTETITESQANDIDPPITAEELKAELTNMGLLNESLAEEDGNTSHAAPVAQPPVQ